METYGYVYIPKRWELPNSQAMVSLFWNKMGAFAREASGIWISRQLSVTTLQKNKGVRTEIMIATSMSISTAVAWAGKWSDISIEFWICFTPDLFLINVNSFWDTFKMSNKTPSNWIGDNYIRHSGFLPVADANDVIMLFPQVIDISNQVNLVMITKFVSFKGWGNLQGLS